MDALRASAYLGAPGRLAHHEIVQAARSHGESVDEALAHLVPMLDGGQVEYQARLEMARVYRLEHRLDEAQAQVDLAASVGNDPQLALERGLIRVWQGRLVEAEPLLASSIPGLEDAQVPLPDGDDPRYWLAIVQARLGRHAEAVATARLGLSTLPDDQASLRVPYHLLLGESLLALGKPADALVAFQAGQRLAPRDRRFAEGLARARAALRQAQGAGP
jgi:tetratricopeptide (TPR) repeat protein